VIQPRRDGFRPRLIACDLDGTLLRPDYSLSTYSAAVLRRIDTIGIPFVIATGRAIGSWLPIADRFPVTAPVVCANGAVIVHGTDADIAAQWPIEAAVLARAVEVIRRRVPDATFAVERGPLQLYEAGYPARSWAPARKIRMVDRSELYAAPAHLLHVRSEASWTSTDADLLVAAPELTVTHSGITGFAEVTASGVSKASAVAWLVEQLGMSPTDVLAFGDMPNDIPLLSWAGRSVAVAGAHRDVLDVVSDQADGSVADGVARYLDRLFDLQVGT
jgi:Cof subfamily protein (haloacid dehalogenase superfamily)